MRLQFLSESRAGSISVPDGFAGVPEAVTCWTYEGDRQLCYIPDQALVPLDPTAFTPDFSVVDANGRETVVYIRNERPSSLVAEWRLRDGVIRTFTDEPLSDADAMRRVIESTVIVEGDHVVPSVSWRAPLVRTPPESPSRRDALVLSAGTDSKVEALAITAVDFGASAPISTRDTGNSVTAWARHEVGIEVSCAEAHGSRRDVERIVALVLGSVNNRMDD